MLLSTRQIDDLRRITAARLAHELNISVEDLATSIQGRMLEVYLEHLLETHTDNEDFRTGLPKYTSRLLWAIATPMNSPGYKPHERQEMLQTTIREADEDIERIEQGLPSQHSKTGWNIDLRTAFSEMIYSSPMEKLREMSLLLRSSGFPTFPLVGPEE